MSYDVTIGPYSLNYTSNMKELFDDILWYQHLVMIAPGQPIRSDEKWFVRGLRCIDGLPGKYARDVIGRAFDILENILISTWTVDEGSRAFREKYDSPNKWGCTDSALIFLGKLMYYCSIEPEEIVRVYS